MTATPQGPDVRTDDLRVVDDEGRETATGRDAGGTADLRVEGGAAAQTDAATRTDTAARSDTELLTGRQRDEFEARWRDVQTGFVDEPRGAVDRADTLVGEVVDAVTAGFSARRSQLEQRWAAEGEEAATENLRQALRAYREFFDRLLKI
ncbi:MAG TPA: hypothetical protein VF218_06025 [Acidothermaceae bacterium]